MLFTPEKLYDFMSQDDMQSLIDYHLNSGTTVYKNTGPSMTNVSKEPAIERALAKIRELYGECTLMNANVFDVDRPHVLHNDLVDSDPDGLAILVPLQFFGNNEYPKFYVFDQRFTERPVKLFGNDPEFMPNNVFINAPLKEYDNVEGTVSTPFDWTGVTTEFNHLRPQWLEGLSINSVFDWVPGDAIVFDRCNIHCASDFREIGVTRKIGLSIFIHKDLTTIEQ